jgi:cytochrome b561
MLKRLLHWAIAIAVVLQLFSCIFLGQSYMPAVPF